MKKLTATFPVTLFAALLFGLWLTADPAQSRSRYIQLSLYGVQPDNLQLNINNTQDVDLGGGLTFIAGEIEEDIETDFAVGYGVGLGFVGGNLFGGDIRVGAEYTYRENSGDVGVPEWYRPLQDQNLPFFPFGKEITYKTQSLLANAVYDLALFNEWHPYAGAGIGVAFIDLETGQGSDDFQEFAWQFIFGVNYNFSAPLALNLGYRYFSLAEDLELDVGNTITTAFSYDAHQFEIGLLYRF